MKMALLECAICETRKSQDLDELQYGALRDAGACQIVCDVCHRSTFWGYVSHERRSGMDRRLYPKPVEALPPEKPAKASAYGGLAPPPAPPVPVVRQEEAGNGDKRNSGERREAVNRVARRVPLELPVRIRTQEFQNTFEEVTRTSNVSKGGIYFHSLRQYEAGMRLKVALNYTGPGTFIEQPAMVVRIDRLPQTTKRGIAVKFV